MINTVIKAIFLSLFLTFFWITSTASAKLPKEVAIIECYIPLSSPDIKVLRANTSSGVTAPTKDTSCAQTLADILNVGFEIVGVSGLTYTLVD